MNRVTFLKMATFAAAILMLAGLLFGQSVQPMEFLVRLEDKVNTQVFCLNPVHKGLRMDRVFFEDSTGEAPCPVCGSSEWLFRKNNAVSKQGHFITFKPAGWSWGTNERKHFGIVKINCTLAQAQAWCEGIRNEQAKADAERYEDEGDFAKAKAAQNRADIDARPRKYVFDFEQVLTVNELKDWNNKEKYSKIITVIPDKLIHIKELAEIQ